MATEEKDSAILVTTTDIHLARGSGETPDHPYQSDLAFHHNLREHLLRVSWAR